MPDSKRLWLLVKSLNLWSGKPLSSLKRRWAELNILLDERARAKKEEDNLKSMGQALYLIVYHPNLIKEILFGEEQETLVSDTFEQELAEALDPFWGEFDETKGIVYAGGT